MGYKVKDISSNSPISKVKKEVQVEPKLKSEPEKVEVSLKPKQSQVETKDVQKEYVLDVIDTSEVKSELDLSMNEETTIDIKSELDLAVNEETSIDKIVNDDVTTKK